jgi:hypothetical protein
MVKSKNPCPVCGKKEWIPCFIDVNGSIDLDFCDFGKGSITPVVDLVICPERYTEFFDFCINCQTVVTG